MKMSGLSSNTRNNLKKLNRTSVFANQQESYLASKEKQRLLRLQAAQAQANRQKLEAQSAAKESDVKNTDQ